jgi:CBS domain-containing protein
MAGEFFVREFMTVPASSLQQSDSLLEAVLLMRRSGFRHIPIVDGDAVVGIITERDIGRVAPSVLGKISPQEYNELFEKTRLEKVMTRDPVTVAPAMSMVDAVTILHQRKYGCLPVVENGRLIGILTVTDVLAMFVQLLGSNSAAPALRDVL